MSKGVKNMMRKHTENLDQNKWELTKSRLTAGEAA